MKKVEREGRKHERKEERSQKGVVDFKIPSTDKLKNYIWHPRKKAKDILPIRYTRYMQKDRKQGMTICYTGDDD